LDEKRKKKGLSGQQPTFVVLEMAGSGALLIGS
jgi:hypothetical protein